jgi:hypothetical protein
MTAGEAMRLLLGQHEQLRTRMSDVWVMARVGASGKPVPGLRPSVEALKRAFLNHEADEERLLIPILARIPPDGSRPMDYLAAHRGEVNDTLSRALAETTVEGITQVERSLAILALVRQLREHLRREEGEFMTEISASYYVTDGFSG